jgi:hypothetical protein
MLIFGVLKNSSTQSDDIKFTNSITKDSFEDDNNNILALIDLVGLSLK